MEKFKVQRAGRNFGMEVARAAGYNNPYPNWLPSNGRLSRSQPLQLPGSSNNRSQVRSVSRSALVTTPSTVSEERPLISRYWAGMRIDDNSCCHSRECCRARIHSDQQRQLYQGYTSSKYSINRNDVRLMDEYSVYRR